MKEMLLINEVKEYIESEREKRKAVAENKGEAVASADNEIEENTPDDSLVSDNNIIAQDP